MDDFRGSGWKSGVAKTCSWTPFGSILGGFFDQNRLKIDIFSNIIFDMIFDRLLIEF